MSQKRLAVLARDSKLSKIIVNVKGEVIEFDKWAELKIDFDNINNELNKQPGLYSYITSILAALTRDWKLKIVTKEKILGQQFIKAKDDFYSQHFKNTSDEYAQSKAKMSIAYRKAAIAEIKAEEKVTVFKGIVESFRQRANTLQQISANTRKELT